MWWDTGQSPWGRLLTVPTTAISCVLAVTAGCAKHQTPFKGPGEDIREDRRQNPEPRPFQMPHSSHALCPVAVGQLKPEAFVQVWCRLAEHQRHFHTHRGVLLPLPWGQAKRLPSLPESLASTYQALGEKMFLTNARLLFEKQG